LTEIEWLPSGKPVVKGPNGPGVSLAHDDWAALAVAGEGSQGCDLAPVEPRTRERWVGLLGAGREPLLDELVAAGDALDVAGTRLWAAAEAARKADGGGNALAIERRRGDAVLLSSGAVQVMTFPLTLPGGPERVVALVVEPEPVAEPEAPTRLAARYGYDPGSYALGVPGNGPTGTPIVSVRFPLTFRECASLSRTLYFSHVFVWMGKVRELACQPVYEPLARQFATGRWGMVSNYAETRFFGEARAEDTVEGQFWLGPASGRLGSTQDLHYDWFRLLPGQEPEPFAWSRMGVTWVEILGHGIVEPRPLPDYYAALMEEMTPPDTADVRAALEPSPPAEPIDLGPELWSARPGPGGGVVLHDEAFDTSLEESNLVGNIYFANYYVWQGVTRDRFFQALAPELYLGTGESGELRCLYQRTDHLREAMPFQRIAARMSLAAVHQSGVRLRFDIYHVDGDRRDKLGAGVHVAGWYAPAGEGEPWRLAPLPDVFRDALLARAGA
jgi:enediyne polyketide synthase